MSVFVCHNDALRRPPLDMSDAERYGSLRYVFGKDVYPDNADRVMPESIERAHTILGDFDPKEDYLALVGSPLLIAICSAVLGSYFSTFRVLRYDRVHRGYYPVTIDLQDEDDDTDRNQRCLEPTGSQPTSGNSETGVCALLKR